MNDELQSFLSRNRISSTVWEQSKCEWPVLAAIRDDYLKQTATLTQSAAFYANLIQNIDCVHSVRWRVKDPEHLLEKIVRKKAFGADKYANINVGNYFDVVTDLVGIRALHLFKDDCLNIHPVLTATWTPSEAPVAYVRNGDPEDLIDRYRSSGLEVKIHPSGYRSVHYVFSSQPVNRRLSVEVQVRTIFEEGWSEIDHTIRYPNFSDNHLVGYFLTIFNRMSGSADEMGGFVRGLVAAIGEYQEQITKASTERDSVILSMEAQLGEMAKLQQQDRRSKEQIEGLRTQVEKLKSEQARGFTFPDPAALPKMEELLYSQKALKYLDEYQDSMKAMQDLANPYKSLKYLDSFQESMKVFQDIAKQQKSNLKITIPDETKRILDGIVRPKTKKK